MKYGKVLLLLISFSHISCSSYHYYKLQDEGDFVPVNIGYVIYDIVDRSPEVELLQDEVVFENSYKSFTESGQHIIDYLKGIKLDNNNNYYSLSLYYNPGTRYDSLKQLISVPNLNLEIDSIFIKLDTPFKSYTLTNFHIERSIYSSYEEIRREQIEVLPIAIPKDYKNKFEISFILRILYKDGTLFNKVKLNLIAEYKKKVIHPLNRWP